MNKDLAATYFKIKIPFIIKFWSLWYYFRPIFWGDIEVKKKWFITGIYNDVESSFNYIDRLIALGQLVTLHDIGIKKIDTTSFFNGEYFPLLVKSAYWTMNDQILNELMNALELTPIKQLYHYKLLLDNNFKPYNIEINSNQPKDYIQAKYKLEFLNKENAPTYQKLCSIDIRNRTLILNAINSLIIEKSKSNFYYENLIDNKRLEQENDLKKIDTLSLSINKISNNENTLIVDDSSEEFSHLDNMTVFESNLMNNKPLRNYFKEVVLQNLFFKFLSLIPIGISKRKYKNDMILQRIVKGEKSRDIHIKLQFCLHEFHSLLIRLNKLDSSDDSKIFINRFYEAIKMNQPEKKPKQPNQDYKEYVLDLLVQVFDNQL